MYEYNVGAGTALELQRTRIRSNGGAGLLVTHANQIIPNAVTSATVRDCLIANNSSDGLRGEMLFDNIIDSLLEIDIARSTITDNAHGVSVFRATGFSPKFLVTLDSTVIYGNVDDIAQNPANPSITSVGFCDIGDGDFAGSNGNFAADPLFVDAPAGDYRVKWASPCTETGNPATVAGGLDVAGNARPIDGDLDTLERFDVGCHEFAPLLLASTGELGTPLTLELWGPQGNATTVYFTRKALVAPQATPFGQLDLDPAFIGIYRVTTVGSGPPKKVTRPIPNSPALIGRTFAFQALTDSSAAPMAKAYTNGVQLTLIP